MKIFKGGTGCGTAAVSDELEAINAFARCELSEDEVFCFSVLLCDNEVDRDNERFDEQTLFELKDLFVGKTGICDHDWQSGNQKARIYRTELVTEPDRKTAAGTDYMYLKGYAYMLRTDANAELIAEINGGIKKETSVGCAVGESRCSVCGEPSGTCAHVRGERYDGKLCYAELHGAVDAYEFSFVAVPAQRESGVIKGFEGAASLKELAEKGGYGREYGELCALAECGKEHISALRGEVLRLSLICDRQLHKALKNSAQRMDKAELDELKQALEKQVCEKMPPMTQLPGKRETTAFDGGEYKI